MRVHLIAPCRAEAIWRKRRGTFTLPQMSLAILSALTPPDIEMKVTDELVEDIDFSYPADAVALSVNTANSLRAYEVARIFREKGAKVLMGGIHPSMLPDEAALHADAIVVGEAEGVWPALIEDLRAGGLKPRYESSHPDPSEIPFPRWDTLNAKRYFVPRTFQVSRGCPHGCSFCSSTRFFGMKYRMRPIGSALEELKSYPRRFIVFVDDNIAGNPDYSKELFTAMRPLKKRWVAQSSIDIAKDETLLRLASESGCAGLLIGLESIRYGNKKDVKKLRALSEYEEMIRRIKRAGIGVHGSFIFGFDDDDLSVFDSTVDFVMRNRLEAANYCKLTPYPGTRLFEAFQKEGRLIHTDWSKYDRYNIVYRPKNLSIDELKQKTDEAYRKTYSLGSILRRCPSVIKSIPYYFALNLSYRAGAGRQAGARNLKISA